MADTRTRIINLPEATTLDPSMNFVEDSADGSGTRRVTYDTLKGAINQEGAVNLAPAYSNAATYNVGDLCTYQGTLYTCNTQISTAEDWTAAHWTLTNMASNLYQLKSDLAPYTSSTYYRQLFTRSGLGINVGSRVSVIESTTRLSMPELQYAKSAISLSVNTGYQFGVVTCDSNNIVIADSGWKTTFAIQSGTYFHVTMRKSNNSEITLDDIDNIFIDEDEFNYTDKKIAIVNSEITSIKNNAENLAIIHKYTNGYLSASGDLVSPSASNERTTDFISVSGTTSITVQQWGNPVDNGLWQGICFYNESKTFISRSADAIGGVTYRSKTYELPNNAVYIRVSYRQGNDILLMVEKGNEPHLYRMSKEDIFILNNIDTNLNSDVDVLKTQANVLTSNIKDINHRGWHQAPENTLVAYKLSKKKGFKYVETDVQFTSDNIPVLLHDLSINRTARNMDGTSISSTVNIADITYAQASGYDFGIYKGNEYAGTKIPKFEDFIKLCRAVGLHPYIELKSDGSYTQAQITGLVDIVKRNGMSENVTWISFSDVFLEYVKTYDSEARLGLVFPADISDVLINKAESLKSTSNEVFIDVDYTALSSEGISRCYNAEIPLEVWTVDTESVVNSLDAYVTGVTSDNLLASVVLYNENII